MADKVEHLLQNQNVRLHQEIKHNLPIEYKLQQTRQLTEPCC